MWTVVNQIQINSTNITTATVYVTVKNIGTATAGQSRTQMDVNPIHSPRNILTPSLAPNAQTTISDTYSPISSGDYTVTSFADILFQVNELNENNNGYGPISFNVP
jgi:subtilase family serine protease